MLNKLLIVLLLQCYAISALDSVEGDCNSKEVALLLSSQISDTIKPNNAAVAKMLAASNEKENKPSLGWRAENPNWNTAISFSAGAIVGGVLGLIAGVAAQNLMSMEL